MFYFQLPVDVTTIRPFENFPVPDSTTQYPSVRNDDFEVIHPNVINYTVTQHLHYD